jgi:hypothetical protein
LYVFCIILFVKFPPLGARKLKREIAAVVVLCAACVEGANRQDCHKGKHTLTLSVRDRTPEKKTGKEAGDVKEQPSEHKSTRGPAEREFFSEESAFAPSLRQTCIKIAQGTWVDTLVKRAGSYIGPLVHRDDSRFVSTDTAQIVDQAVRTRLQDTSAIAYAKAKPKQKELDVAIGGVWAVLEMTEGDPVLTVLELRRTRFCHNPQ